jgi:hypothetical protein
MLLRARSAKTERKTENQTKYLCPLQRSVLPDVLELRRQNGGCGALYIIIRPCILVTRYQPMFPRQQVMVRPQFADGGDGLQIRRVTAYVELQAYQLKRIYHKKES